MISYLAQNYVYFEVSTHMRNLSLCHGAKIIVVQKYMVFTVHLIYTYLYKYNKNKNTLTIY